MDLNDNTFQPKRIDELVVRTWNILNWNKNFKKLRPQSLAFSPGSGIMMTLLENNENYPSSYNSSVIKTNTNTNTMVPNTDDMTQHWSTTASSSSSSALPHPHLFHYYPHVDFSLLSSKNSDSGKDLKARIDAVTHRITNASLATSAKNLAQRSMTNSARDAGVFHIEISCYHVVQENTEHVPVTSTYADSSTDRSSTNQVFNEKENDNNGIEKLRIPYVTDESTKDDEDGSNSENRDQLCDSEIIKSIDRIIKRAEILLSSPNPPSILITIVPITSLPLPLSSRTIVRTANLSVHTPVKNLRGIFLENSNESTHENSPKSCSGNSPLRNHGIPREIYQENSQKSLDDILNESNGNENTKTNLNLNLRSVADEKLKEGRGSGRKEGKENSGSDIDKNSEKNNDRNSEKSNGKNSERNSEKNSEKNNDQISEKNNCDNSDDEDQNNQNLLYSRISLTLAAMIINKLTDHITTINTEKISLTSVKINVNLNPSSRPLSLNHLTRRISRQDINIDKKNKNNSDNHYNNSKSILLAPQRVVAPWLRKSIHFEFQSYLLDNLNFSQKKQNKIFKINPF